MRRSAAVVVLAALAGACEWPESQTPPAAGLAHGVEAPVALGSALGFVERATGTVFLVDAPAGVPRARAVLGGRNPVEWTARKGADELLVLSVGEAGGNGILPEAAALWRIPTVTAVPVKIPLPARFSALAQSPDGRFVIAFFRGGTSSAASDSLFNPNQVAIVDLSAVAPVAITRSLRSAGAVPLDIDYSPSLALPAEARTLAVVRSVNAITLIDMNHLERSEITVPLTLTDDTRRLTPVQILFDVGVAGKSDPTLYVRATGTSDIFALRLGALAAADVATAGGHDFRPSLSQLAGGTNPVDMALYDDEVRCGPNQEQCRITRLLVGGAGRELVVIDAGTSRTLSIPLDHGVSAIRVWTGPAPGEMAAKPRALLVGSAGSNQITFVDLHDLEDLKTRNLETQIMVGAAQNITALLPERVLIRHPTVGQASVVSVVDLGKRSVTPISSRGEIRLLRTSDALPTLLWIVNGTEKLGFLNLQDLGIGVVGLDAPVADLMVTTPPVGGKGSVLVVHPGVEGYVTALDPVMLDRAHAKSIRGFVTTGLLDRLDRSLPLSSSGGVQ